MITVDLSESDAHWLLELLNREQTGPRALMHPRPIAKTIIAALSAG